MGNARSFMASVFRVEQSPTKLMHGLALLFHAPHVVSFQSLEQREEGLKKLWSVMSFYPHWCDQYICL